MQLQDHFLFSVDVAWVLDVKITGLDSISKGRFYKSTITLPPPEQNVLQAGLENGL